MKNKYIQFAAGRAFFERCILYCQDIVLGSSRCCSVFSRLVMVICLLPWAVVRKTMNLSVVGTGKQWFVSLLESAPEALWVSSEWGRLRRWGLLIPLVFAQRIRWNQGFFPALWDTCCSVARTGRIALIAALDPQTGIPIPPECWAKPLCVGDILATLARVPGASHIYAEDVSLVIPVYNGMDHLKHLLPSLLQHTPEGVRILIVDDASPDPEIGRILQEYLRERKNVLLLRNDSNLGFTATVNYAMSHVETPYAVLLNTDTIVVKDWLPRLIAPFTSAENLGASSKIASVTPFSNAAVFFSFPLCGQDNDFIPPFSLEECDAAFAGLDATTGPWCDVHSGVGFCMAVSMDCWHEIGPLDEIAFARGYGEECDWCMRASAHGWRNVLVPNLFILHRHGGSFLSEEKQKLCDEHQQILRQRWPEAMRRMEQHARQDPWKAFRIMAAWRMTSADKGCLLMVDLDSSEGGAVAYREKQIEKLSREGWRVLLLRYSAWQGKWSLSCRHLPEEQPVQVKHIEEMDLFFSAVHVRRVFVNNFAFHPHVEDIVDFFAAMKRRHGFHLHYVFHDFLSVCPSFFLMGADTKFCHIPKVEKCSFCAPHNSNRIIERDDLVTWRKHWNVFLELCDSTTCFSESSKELINQVYTLGDKLVVQEHEPLVRFSERFQRPQLQGAIELAFIGNFSTVKGSDMMRSLMRLLLSRGVNTHLHIFGLCGMDESDLHIINHGPYEKRELPRLLWENQIAAVVFPSIYPETFSYVVQECMAIEVPLVCFDLGAPPERIRKYVYPHAVICQDITVESMARALEELIFREYGVQLFSVT